MRRMFRAKVSATLGWGGGDLAGTIGFGAIIEFVQFVYHQLNNNNFSYVEFMKHKKRDNQTLINKE